MKNELVGLSVGVVCAIVMIGTILVPNIEDFTQTEETFTNSGMYYMTDTTDTITYEYLGDTSWTVNGEELVYEPYGATNIIVANDIFVRNVGQVRGSTTITMASAEFTVSNGTVTGTITLANSSTVDVSWDCSEVFYGAVNESSDYLMKNYDESVYVSGDSHLFGIGLSRLYYDTSSSSWVTTTFIVDVVGDTATVECLTDDVEITDIVVNLTAVDGYEDLYLFDSVTFTSTYTGSGDYDTGEYDQTYNTIVVPSSVTAELSQHMTESEIVLISIIPLFTILAVLCAVVYAVMRNRD